MSVLWVGVIMIEYEKFNKVIKGLECRSECGESQDCTTCDYGHFDGVVWCCDIPSICSDALALLKLQKETIPIDFLMRYAQLPTEFAISAWEKPIRDALKNKAKDTDKPMSFDDALQLVNGILSNNRGEER